MSDTHDINTKISECIDSFYAMRELYPSLIKQAAEARYVYDQAKAKAHKDILDTATANGEKKPTDETIKAMVTLAVAKEQKAVRDAEANLDAAKWHLDSLKHILSGLQTQTHLPKIEAYLATAGGFGN
jgi:hypothetical protein